MQSIFTSHPVNEERLASRQWLENHMYRPLGSSAAASEGAKAPASWPNDHAHHFAIETSLSMISAPPLSQDTGDAEKQTVTPHARDRAKSGTEELAFSIDRHFVPRLLDLSGR